MGIDSARQFSRRSVVRGGVAGVAAAGVAAVVATPQALAGQGFVHLGEGNQANSATRFTRATVDTYAHLASDTQGVIGHTGEFNGIGVFGRTSGNFSQAGVEGSTLFGNGEGVGVRGRTSVGIAVYAEATNAGGYALQTVGRTVFSRSGKVTFIQGDSSKTITGHAITPASLVLATIQGNVAGMYVRGVSLNDNANTFTIRLNKAATSNLRVGWLIVN